MDTSLLSFLFTINYGNDKGNRKQKPVVEKVAITAMRGRGVFYSKY